MEAKYYNYILLDTRKPGIYKYGVNGRAIEFKYEPFYVGKGCNNQKYFYLREANRGVNLIRDNIIDKIRDKTREEPLIIEFNTNLEEKEAYNLGQELIEDIGKLSLGQGPLVNLDKRFKIDCEFMRKGLTWKDMSPRLRKRVLWVENIIKRRYEELERKNKKTWVGKY